MKKYILGIIIALLTPFALAYASTPVLTATGTNDANAVSVQVSKGEINAPVVLFYNATTGGSVKNQNIGYTDANGNFTGSVNTSALGITQNAPVYVQVGGYQSLPVNWPSSIATGSSSMATITFAPTSPSFAVGQNGTVTLSGGGSGTYYISSNSNPNWTSAAISGNTLQISGSQMGQTTLTICSTSGSCAVLTPTFTNTAGSMMATSTSGFTGTTGAPTLSSGNLSVGMNGQGSITLSGGTMPYTVTPISGNSVSTTLIGNTLYVTGTASGTTAFNVCSASTTGTLCSPFTVNVSGTGTTNMSNGNNGATTTTTSGNSTTTGMMNGPLSFSIAVPSGQMAQLALSGGSGNYYVQPLSGSTLNTSLSGNTLTLTGLSQGSTTVDVCDQSPSSTTSGACLPVTVTVGPSLTGTGGGYFFENDVSEGMSGEDVTELQQRLKDLGDFSGDVTGYFGPITMAAVEKYQRDNGISATGYVGPLTRAAFNK